MDQFRNIGLIGRLGSKSVIDTLRHLIRFLHTFISIAYFKLMKYWVKFYLRNYKKNRHLKDIGFSTFEMLFHICFTPIIVNGMGTPNIA